MVEHDKDMCIGCVIASEFQHRILKIVPEEYMARISVNNCFKIIV